MAPDAAWWREAEAAVAAPTPEVLAQLRESAAGLGGSSDPEERDEMLAGLEALAALAAGDLPVLTTQHRVIGADVCHMAVPVTMADELPVPGKLFVTSARLIVAAGGSRAWPWHRVRQVVRSGREVLVAGAGDGVKLVCNNFADALAVEYLARRLSTR